MFGYDDDGRLTSLTRADGSQMRATYNDLGLPVELTQEGGARWQQEFDERGNRLSVTDPAGRTTHYTHDSLGHITSVTDAVGAVTQLRRNTAGLLVERVDPAAAGVAAGAAFWVAFVRLNARIRRELGARLMPGLDPLLRHPTRLTVIAFLSGCTEAEFSAVRDYCQVSDSVLSKTASALEEAGYIAVRKGYVGKRPSTWLADTRTGRQALADHLAVLQQLVATAEAAGAEHGEA
ncbi:transcriptional regulator [Streptomyces sp. NPDC000880]